jgi:hypothetical protein
MSETEREGWILFMVALTIGAVLCLVAALMLTFG